jgi:hypothetical protein
MEQEIIRLIIDGLAVFRLTILIAKDDGPGYIFWKLRKAPPKRSSFHQGISCPFCVSVWMGFPVAVYERLLPHSIYADAFLLWLAFSAVAICLNQSFTKD